MTYGISVKNESGFINIDETFANMQVLVSGTLSAPGTVTFPEQATRPLVMVSLSSNGIWDANGTPPGDHISNNNSFRIGSAVTQDVKYKVLVPRASMVPSSDAFGMRVYGPSGELFFDSGNLDTLKVLANVFTSYEGPNPQPPLSVSIPSTSGDVYASLHTLQYYKGEAGNPFRWKTIAARRVSSTEVSLVEATSWTFDYNFTIYGYYRYDRYFLVGTFP